MAVKKHSETDALAKVLENVKSNPAMQGKIAAEDVSELEKAVQKEHKKVEGKDKDVSRVTSAIQREERQSGSLQAKVSPDEAKARKDAEREQEKQEKEREKRKDAAIENIKDTVSDAADNARDNANALYDKVASLRTIGGIGLPLLILIILLFIVVQVNAQGDTRLKQLWYMLSGRAQLIGRRTPEHQASPESHYAQQAQDILSAEQKVAQDVQNVTGLDNAALTVIGGFFPPAGAFRTFS